MPLLNIPYQPLAFSMTRPTDCFGCDEREYCMPVLAGDFIYGQFKQTPCEPSIACDGDLDDFSNEEAILDVNFDNVTIEQLLNGNFTGSAANWTLQTDWSYAANAISKVASATPKTFEQILDTPTFANGIYKIVYTVSGYGGSGTINPFFQASTGAFSRQGATSAGNGTFTIYMKSYMSGGVGAGASFTKLGFNATTAWTGTIDSISLRRIAYQWDFGEDIGGGGGAWQLNTSGFAETINQLPQCVSTPLRMNGVVTPNTLYNLQVVINSGTGGFLAFSVGGTITPATIVTGATTININGILSGAGTDFFTYHPLGFCGTIETISLLSQESTCWEFDPAHWVTSNSSICHTPGTADDLTNSPIVTPGYYQVKFTVQGMTQGTINSRLDNQFGQLLPITENGNYTHYFTTVNNSQLQFQVNNLFDGCISAVELFVLRQDFVFELRDTQGNLIEDISSWATYFEDYVTLAFRIGNLTSEPDFGCYQIYAYDFCEVQFEEIIGDGDMNTIIGTYDGAMWFDAIFTNFPGNYLQNINGEMVFHSASLGNAQFHVWNCSLGRPNCPGTHPAIPSGTHNYRIEFDVIQNTNPAVHDLQVRIDNILQTTVGDTTVGHHIYNVSFDPDDATDGPLPLVSVQATFRTPTGGDEFIIIDNLTMRRIEPFDATFTSKCIKYVSEAECTSYINAYCETPQMGFNFIDTGFRLAHRIYVRAINPSYPESSADYLFSEGTKQRNFGQSEKSYVLITGLLPEWSHDTIAKQLICQHFEVGEPGTLVEWFPLPSDYVPEYPDKGGDVMLASGRFEVQLKDGDTKFFRND